MKRFALPAAWLGAWLLAFGAFGGVVLSVDGAVASPSSSSPEQRFRQGVKALQEGAFNEAIDQFELLADRGFVHPDASFNRGLAYVLRARSAQSRPGDLGRAAAAFDETVVLRPSDEAAERALERVRRQIARQRARERGQPVSVRSSLNRAVVGLVSENIWAVGAAIGSVLLTIGLILRWWTRSRPARLTGATGAAVGAIILLGCGGLTLAARHLRLTTHPAVVVAPKARLLDAAGTPLDDSESEHDAVPEGARVYVLEQQGRRARVQWGPVEGWVSAGQIRRLATP